MYLKQNSILYKTVKTAHPDFKSKKSYEQNNKDHKIIWRHPLKIDVKTSIASTLLPVTFLDKMKYLFSN